VTGPDVAHRLAPVLALHGIDLTDQPDDGEPVQVGWEPGMFPLRPAQADRHAIRAALAGATERRWAWAVVDHLDPGWTGDGGPAALVAAATDALGPGHAYLGGVAWADDPEALALDPEATARLLAATVVRLWWRPTGTLDALRVVESLEAGCLPVQVMPVRAAAARRAGLAPPLAALVLDVDQLATLTPSRIETLRANLGGLVLAGSVERDVAVAVAGAAHHAPEAA
jgi:hypothetical protein